MGRQKNYLYSLIMKHIKSPDIFLQEKNMKETSHNDQFFSFFDRQSCWRFYIYFKLKIQVCLICLTAVVKISSISCFSFIKFSRLKGEDKNGIIMTLWIGLHKFANVVFGITQKPLCIKLSKLSRRKITENLIFLNGLQPK